MNAKEQEFRDEQRHVSQVAKILARLRQTPGEWVGMFELYQVSGSMAVHSRISNLRELGHDIDQENRRKGTQIHSFYRLKVVPQVGAPATSSAPAVQEELALP